MLKSSLPCLVTIENKRNWNSSPYLGAVFTFIVLATVVGHLVTNKVRLPVEGFGALVTLVFSLLCVCQQVAVQAAGSVRESALFPFSPVMTVLALLGHTKPHMGPYKTLSSSSFPV